MSADSLAMSTAVSTEMPTSAALMAAASLMPSPMKPTVWPLSRRAATMRDFCWGVSLAKTLVFSTASFNWPSVNPSICEPRIMFSAERPTCLQTALVTASLSPVRTLTSTPESFKAAMASAVLSLGGSRKAR